MRLSILALVLAAYSPLLAGEQVDEVKQTDSLAHDVLENLWDERAPVELMWQPKCRAWVSPDLYGYTFYGYPDEACGRELRRWFTEKYEDSGSVEVRTDPEAASLFEAPNDRSGPEDPRPRGSAERQVPTPPPAVTLTTWKQGNNRITVATMANKWIVTYWRPTDTKL
jgi:hypothetical protein